MTLYTFLFDLLCLAILIGCAVWYTRKGFLVGIISFFGMLISLVLALVLAQALAPWLFDTLFRRGLEESMTAALAQQAPANVNELLDNMLGFLPQEMIDSLAAALGPSLNFAAPDIAAQAVDSVVAPLVTPFIAIVGFFILFIVLRLVFWLLKKLARGVGSVPVVSLVNKALGAVMGIFVGALYVYLLLCVLWAWDAMSPETAIGLKYLSGSVVYRLAYPLNFFA